jgi:hypothetical protein
LILAGESYHDASIDTRVDDFATHQYILLKGELPNKYTLGSSIFSMMTELMEAIVLKRM